jgi:hypothetical protein
MVLSQGVRTLNLGIKRRLTVRARKRQDVPGRASRVWRFDPFASQSVLTCHGAPWLSCQTSCHPSPACPKDGGVWRWLADFAEDIWQKDVALYFDLETVALSI